MTTTAPYGSWVSPITAAQAAAASGTPNWVDFVGDEVWWTESRTSEGGRVTVMRRRGDGEPEELLPAPWNARNRVHEYGGKPWANVDGVCAFTNWDDQQIYGLDVHLGDILPLTPRPAERHGVRYSDLRAERGREVWAVRETSTGPAPTDVHRDLVAVPLVGGEVTVLGRSHHFMTSPKLSPDGRRAAWIGWEHPDMPWDSAELCVAEVLPDGTFAEHRVVAGGNGVSVCQVEWESNDTLLASMDPHGWWNLHRVRLSGDVENLLTVDEELGGPLWVLGSRWFTALGDGRFAVLRSGGLAVLDERAGTLSDVPATGNLPVWASAIAAKDGVVVGVAGGPRQHPAVFAADLAGDQVRQVSMPTGDLPAQKYLPVPQERVFTGQDGQEIPAYVYPPTNPDFSAPEGELPPYVVHVHGGPTSRFSPVLELKFAFLTSRGIGVVAVNYGGSTGYGREFRERLREQWGIVDVADCAAVADALAAEGSADSARLAIRGGSAGGYTSALSATTVRTFAAATVMFPVIDLLTFASGETHDFESRYLDGLVGPLPETRQRYVDRSPLSHVDGLACPVLLLQGLEDQICPPVQAERFIAAIRGKGIRHAYVPFDGEQHGFRRAETITAALEAEVSFYGQVLGFAPPGIEPVELST